SVSAGRRHVDPDIAAAALSAERPPLTERELDVLRVGRSAATGQEIADALHLAPGTARNYLSQAMQKLGGATRRAASATARPGGAGGPRARGRRAPGAGPRAQPAVAGHAEAGGVGPPRGGGHGVGGGLDLSGPGAGHAEEDDRAAFQGHKVIRLQRADPFSDPISWSGGELVDHQP